MYAPTELKMTRNEKAVLAFFLAGFVVAFATIALHLLVPEFGGMEWSSISSLLDFEQTTPSLVAAVVSLATLFFAFKF